MARSSTPVRIAPSILSADFARLGEEVAAAEKGQCDFIHVDVMDGHFVPNITIGVPVVRSLRKTTKLPLDVHLMISEPERYVDEFAEAGADIITVHAEATNHLQRLVTHIRSLGKKAGVSLNPHTPEAVLHYILGDIDLVLVMSVNPGFGGQEFLPSVLPKIEAIRSMIDRAKVRVDLEVDGGIKPGIAKRVVDAGADVLVAGSAVFGQKNIADAIRALREDRS